MFLASTLLGGTGSLIGGAASVGQSALGLATGAGSALGGGLLSAVSSGLGGGRRSSYSSGYGSGYFGNNKPSFYRSDNYEKRRSMIPRIGSAVLGLINSKKNKRSQSVSDRNYKNEYDTRYSKESSRNHRAATSCEDQRKRRGRSLDRSCDVRKNSINRDRSHNDYGSEMKFVNNTSKNSRSGLIKGGVSKSRSLISNVGKSIIGGVKPDKKSKRSESLSNKDYYIGDDKRYNKKRSSIQRVTQSSGMVNKRREHSLDRSYNNRRQPFNKNKSSNDYDSESDFTIEPRQRVDRSFAHTDNDYDSEIRIKSKRKAYNKNYVKDFNENSNESEALPKYASTKPRRTGSLQSLNMNLDGSLKNRQVNDCNYSTHIQKNANEQNIEVLRDLFEENEYEILKLKKSFRKYKGISQSMIEDLEKCTSTKEARKLNEVLETITINMEEIKHQIFKLKRKNEKLENDIDNLSSLQFKNNKPIDNRLGQPSENLKRHVSQTLLATPIVPPILSKPIQKSSSQVPNIVSKSRHGISSNLATRSRIEKFQKYDTDKSFNKYSLNQGNHKFNNHQLFENRIPMKNESKSSRIANKKHNNENDYSDSENDHKLSKQSRSNNRRIVNDRQGMYSDDLDSDPRIERMDKAKNKNPIKSMFSKIKNKFKSSESNSEYRNQSIQQIEVDNINESYYDYSRNEQPSKSMQMLRKKLVQDAKKDSVKHDPSDPSSISSIIESILYDPEIAPNKRKKKSLKSADGIVEISMNPLRNYSYEYSVVDYKIHKENGIQYTVTYIVKVEISNDKVMRTRRTRKTPL